MPSLPFIETARIEKLGGALLAEVDVTVWPLGGARTTPSGETYDWIGEADPAGKADLAGSNRQLVAGGERFNVVSVIEHELGIPHLELLLRAAGPKGGVR